MVTNFGSEYAKIGMPHLHSLLLPSTTDGRITTPMGDITWRWTLDRNLVNFGPVTPKFTVLVGILSSVFCVTTLIMLQSRRGRAGNATHF